VCTSRRGGGQDDAPHDGFEHRHFVGVFGQWRRSSNSRVGCLARKAFAQVLARQNALALDRMPGVGATQSIALCLLILYLRFCAVLVLAPAAASVALKTFGYVPHRQR
jgi:hypothetical protein